MHAHASKEELPLIFASLWASRMGRNKCVLEGAPCDLMQLFSSMCKLVSDYILYAQKIQVAPRHGVHTFASWQPPNEGWIKLNFDAHVGLDCIRGLGVVAR